MRCAITWPDGTHKYLSLNAAPLETSGRAPQVVFSVQDVTERYQAEQQLRAEQRFSEAAINSLPGIFFMVDAQGTTHRWNDALLSVTGRSPEDMARSTLADFVVPSDAPRVRQAVRDAFATTIQVALSVNLRSASGGSVPYMLTAAPVTIDGTTYLVGVGLDITEQRERERALNRARQQADEARAEAERMSALKTSFLTNMSHEVRTPLTTMMGYATILVDDDDPPQRFAQYIVDGGQRLLSTLDDILTFSQLDAETYALTRARTDVVATVRAAIADVDPQCTTQANMPKAAPQVLLDARAVTTMATHLLRNAAAFTEPDDTVTVRVEVTEAGTRLVVSDTGAGMPAEYVPHATEPFTQASQGAARTHEGSGLGLAIVHALAVLMEGTVDIDTEMGAGTTVSVWMPHPDPFATDPS